MFVTVPFIIMLLILLLICMFDTIAQEIPLQRIDFYGRELWIKRLDLVHPYISGNKFYKLKYNF